jgi:hypothetical protein
VAKPTREPGTRAIDVIRAKSALERRKIVVPEWGLTFYFGKMTVADMEAVDARRKEGEEMTHQHRNMVLLVAKAQDEDGTPMFGMGDIMFLKSEADFVVLQRVVNFMFESAYQSIEAEVDGKKKEIESNPPSASA